MDQAHTRAGGTCRTHGNRRHATVHEAGHLLAALQRQVPFKEVVIHQEPVELSSGRGWAAGWVSIDEDRIAEVPPVLLLEFAVAGGAAELAVLGDRLVDGAREDMANWKRWHKLGTETDPEVFASLVGEPIAQVFKRIARWGTVHAETIELLAAVLDEQGRMTSADAKAVLDR